MALVAGGAANSMIIFHAESVKVPVNCTLTSASELEAALPKELLPISALGKRIHHCRPRETAKSFPELPAAKPPRSPRSFLFFLFFSSLRRGSEGGCRIVSALCGSGKNGSAAALEGGTGCLWAWVSQRVPTAAGQRRGPSPWPCGACTGDVPKVPAGRFVGQLRPRCWGPSAFGLLLGLTRGSGFNPLLSASCWLQNSSILPTGVGRELLGAWPPVPGAPPAWV